MNEIPTSSKALGGYARAKALTPEERSAIGINAARARWGRDIPTANYQGTLNIAGAEIRCAVHDLGDRVVRVIVQREVVGLLTGNKKGNLDRYLKPKNLEPYVPAKFKDKVLEDATIVLVINGRKAFCYEGEDIVDLCKMYLDARKTGGILLPSQLQLAERAELLVTSLAKTGITGLIDEATGYQHIRAKDALQAYLNKILRNELAAWVRRFPDDFFREIYRLKQWDWKGNGKYPPVMGKYIVDIVYKRLGPGILNELLKLNPKGENGRRPAKHHQWLTDDIGHPALSQHLYSVIGLMRISDDWNQFKTFLNKAYRVRDELQLALGV